MARPAAGPLTWFSLDAKAEPCFERWLYPKPLMSPTNPALAATLKKAGLFCSLSKDELTFLAKRVLSHRYHANELIFFEGDPCE
ncbi:MAG: hypothetical protein ACRD3O_21025, partial [Terriglobia bacterium]